jgi:hypothetical protein
VADLDLGAGEAVAARRAVAAAAEVSAGASRLGLHEIAGRARALAASG